MSRRDIPKVLAEFGRKQFTETGADEVEVLRVKASTIRKYWPKLQGAMYIVSVIRSDGARVYFFNAQAMLMVGENTSHQQYTKIRSKSKLLKRFERPKPPTELELRMEATEDVRSAMTKAIRRVSRFLGRKEPSFPVLFVSKEIDVSSPSPNLFIDDDGSFVFLESAVNSDWLGALSINAAFLSFLEGKVACHGFAHRISEFVASCLMSGNVRDDWNSLWIKQNKDTLYEPLVQHLIRHQDVYGGEACSRILDFLRAIPENLLGSVWPEAMNIIHDAHEVSLGTEAFPIFEGFLASLQRHRKLQNFVSPLPSIHLEPRAICNVVPLGISLSVSISENPVQSEWLSIGFHEGRDRKFLSIDENPSNRIQSIHYHLNVDDIFPKTGGITTRGKAVLHWIHSHVNETHHREPQYSASVSQHDKNLKPADLAVLERLSSGNPEVLANTLIGSPQRVDALVRSGCLAFVPSFNHLGLDLNYLIEGEYDEIESIIPSNSLESTTLQCNDVSFSIVSAPSIWGERLKVLIADTNLALWPIFSIHSQRRIVRYEEPLL